MIRSGVGSVRLIRGLDSEIGFGPRGTLESVCAWPCGRSAVIKEPWCSAVFVWTRLEPSAAVAATYGPVRRLAVEIGFGSASGPWPVWRLAAHGPRTAGFLRFRIDTDCVRLPDHLFPWADSEIEHRNRIRAKGNTGISVCPAARLIGDNRRTLVFRRFRMGAGGDCLPWGPPSWTSSEIGPRDWIWSVWDVGDWRCDDLYRFREPRYFAVSGLVCATSVCCWGGVRGLIRRSGVGLGIGPNAVCGLSAVCGKESRNTAVPG